MIKESFFHTSKSFTNRRIASVEAMAPNSLQLYL